MNLKDMEDLPFPDPEVMADWLRRNREHESMPSSEELQLPLPLPELWVPVIHVEPVTIQLSNCPTLLRRANSFANIRQQEPRLEVPEFHLKLLALLRKRCPQIGRQQIHYDVIEQSR